MKTQYLDQNLDEDQKIITIKGSNTIITNIHEDAAIDYAEDTQESLLDLFLNYDDNG